MTTQRKKKNKQKLNSNINKNANANKISNHLDVDNGIRANEYSINLNQSNQHKNNQTFLSSNASQVKRKGPFVTSTKQMAGYFTVHGIENEISLAQKDWPCFALKELSDNAYDWLNDYYPITTINGNSSSNGGINYDSKTRRYIAVRYR